jgi:preprotein translocase subunit YajC
VNYIRLLARSICPARQITSLTQRALIVAAFAFFALDFGSAFVGASVAQAQEGQSLAAAQVDPATLGAISPEQDPNQRPGFGDVLFKMLPMFFMVFFIFYFMVIKPQQQKLKSQQDLLQSLKKGDSVVTTGGIIAKVAAIESDHVMLDIAPNVRLKLEPSHVAKRFEKNPQEKDKAAA